MSDKSDLISNSYKEVPSIIYKTNTVQHHPNKDVCAWKISRAFILQTTDPVIAQQVKSWSFSECFALGVNCNYWSFIIPRKKFRWVCKTLGLPPPIKSPGRVRHGKSRSQILNSKAERPS